MKLRLPILLVALLSHAAVLSAWEDTPYTYNSSGGTLIIDLDGDRAVDNTGLDAGEAAIKGEGGGELVFDGGQDSGPAYSLEFSMSANRAILVDGSLAMRHMSELSFDADIVYSYDLVGGAWGGVISAMQNVSFNEIESVNFGGMTLVSFEGGKGAGIYAGGDISFSKIDYLNLENYQWEIYGTTVNSPDDESVGMGGALYAGGTIRISDMEYELNIGGNEITISSGSHVTSDDMFPKSVAKGYGGAFYSETGVEITRSGEINMHCNSVYSYAESTLRLPLNSPMTALAIAYGGAMYSEGDILFSENTSLLSFQCNKVVTSANLAEGPAPSRMITSAYDVSEHDANAIARGGALYAEGSIIIRDHKDAVNFTTNYANANSSGTATAEGGALYATTGILLEKIEGDVTFDGNYASSYVENAYEDEFLTEGAYAYARGGALYSGGTIGLFDIDGDLTFHYNNSYVEIRTVIPGHYDGRGGALYAEDDILISRVANDLKFDFNNIGGDFAFNNETDEVDFSLPLLSTGELYGAGIYSQGSVEITHIGGDAQFYDNTISGHTYGSIIQKGGAIYTAGGLSINNIGGTLSFDSSSLYSSSILENSPESEISMTMMGASIYAEGNVSIKSVEELKFLQNRIEINSYIGGTSPVVVSTHATGIYSGQSIGMEDIRGEFLIDDNHSSINLSNSGFRESEVTLVGNVFYAVEDIVIKNIAGPLAATGNTARISFDDPTHDVVLAGGVFYAGRDLVIQDFESGELQGNSLEFNTSTNTNLDDLDGIRTLSVNQSLELGGAVGYAAGNIQIGKIEGDVFFSGNHLDSFQSFDLNGSDSDVEDISVQIESLIEGVALRAGESLVIGSVSGDLTVDSNTVSFHRTASFSFNDIAPETLIYFGDTLTGGALYSEGVLQISSIAGDTNITGNEMNYTLQGGVYSYAEEGMPSSVVTLIADIDMYGGAMFSGGDLVIGDMEGNFTLEMNGMTVSYNLGDSAEEGSLFRGNVSISGGAAASEGDLHIGSIAGDVSLVTNNIQTYTHISACDSIGIYLDAATYAYGGALAAGKSLYINEIEGDLEVFGNNILSYNAATNCSFISVTSTGWAKGGAFYAGEDLVFSQMSGDINIYENYIMAGSDLEGNYSGGAAHAEGILWVRETKGISVFENFLEAELSFYTSQTPSHQIEARAAGGAFSAEGGYRISGNEGVIEFYDNYISASVDGEAYIDAQFLGGALYSGGTIVFGDNASDWLMEGNNMDITGYSSAAVTVRALGGAVYSAGGLVMEGLQDGDFIFRGNSIQVELETHEDMSESLLEAGQTLSIIGGGALALGGDSLIQNVKGTILFDSNYVVGTSLKQDEAMQDALLQVGGGALFVEAGGTVVLNANEGNILFTDNKAGIVTEDLENRGQALGGAIFVEGSDTMAQGGTLVLAAEPGHIIAFSGNKDQAEFVVDENWELVYAEGTGKENAIHMDWNTLLGFSGTGSIFMFDPVTTDERGGVGLFKQGSGTVYFYDTDYIFHASGRGEDAARVEAGTLHVDGETLVHIEGEGSMFQVNQRGILAGSGVFKADGGFVISGSLSPDSRRHTLEDYLAGELGRAAAPAAMSAGDMGILTLDGDVAFNNAALTFEINMVDGTGDRVVMTGDYEGTGRFVANVVGDDLSVNPWHKVVIAEAYGAVADGSVIDGPFDAGLYRIRITSGENPNGPGTAWWTTYEEEPSTIIDVALNTSGAMSNMWFRQLDNLVKRMGDMRLTPEKYGTADVWFRSYGMRADVDLKIRNINGFREYQYGMDMGVDRFYRIDDYNKLGAGVFTGYQRADRKFNDPFFSKGDVDSYSGGAYATWLEKSGWFADMVVKGQHFQNHGRINGNQPSRFRYDTWGLGISLESGRQFALENNWFIEPTAQISWMHLDGKNYTTSRDLRVTTKSTEAVQFSAMVRSGRNFQLCTASRNSQLQMYMKAGVVEEASSGGVVRVEQYSWRPNTDGVRAVVGAGVVWQCDRHQIHLDYEANFGEKVDIPWNVNLGYRVSF